MGKTVMQISDQLDELRYRCALAEDMFQVLAEWIYEVWPYLERMWRYTWPGSWSGRKVPPPREIPPPPIVKCVLCDRFFLRKPSDALSLGLCPDCEEKDLGRWPDD